MMEQINDIPRIEASNTQTDHAIVNVLGWDLPHCHAFIRPTLPWFDIDEEFAKQVRLMPQWLNLARAPPHLEILNDSCQYHKLCRYILCKGMILEVS
jgi:hypothetical protein